MIHEKNAYIKNQFFHNYFTQQKNIEFLIDHYRKLIFCFNEEKIKHFFLLQWSTILYFRSNLDLTAKTVNSF